MAQSTSACLLLLLFLGGAFAATVTLDQGTLRGSTLTSHAGANIFAFRAIPYAAPPLGDLRFKAPQDAAAWDGERSAENWAPTCPQINYLTRAYEGQEDCLYLNVYTPKLEREGPGLSVMVWFHGGGFFSGSGNADMYSPEFILDHEVILVTINYRLGALGFLSLNTTSVPGNYGLKDQAAALRWVNRNIEKFGGNPNSVTIFGESAGGASIHYLMLSPLTRGLFHRAIAQSGSAHNDWAFERTPEVMARDLGTKLGCGSTDNEGLMSCFREVDAKRLEETSNAMMAEKDIPTVFAPSVEPADTHGAFLLDDPARLLLRGEIADVPFIAGLLTHEGMYQLGALAARNLGPEQDLATHYKNYVPTMLELGVGTPDFEAAWQDIKSFYERIYPDNPLERFIILNSDVEFVSGVDFLVRKFAQLHRSPVYYYQFSYDGGRSLIKSMAQIKLSGTCHGDELGYMFTGTLYPPLQNASPEDLLTSQRLTKMWTNFAKSGNPTPDGSLGVEWKPVDATSDEVKTRYLDIGTQLVMTNENLNENRNNFWRKFIRQHRRPSN